MGKLVFVTLCISTDTVMSSFGAVLEEFELRDAMNAILATKFDPSVMNG